MKRTAIAGLLVLAAGFSAKSAFGQFNSTESLSGFHLGMTKNEVAEKLKAQNDLKTMPIHPENPNSGFMLLGHSWSNSDGPFGDPFEGPSVCYATAAPDSDRQDREECDVKYTFYTLCPTPSGLSSCFSVTKKLEFTFSEDGRVYLIGFRNTPDADDEREEKNPKAHEALFIKYREEGKKKFGGNALINTPFKNKIWWLSKDTYACPGEFGQDWKGDIVAGRDARYQYQIAYVDGNVTEVWIMLFDGKMEWGDSCHQTRD